MAMHDDHGDDDDTKDLSWDFRLADDGGGIRNWSYETRMAMQDAHCDDGDGT